MEFSQKKRLKFKDNAPEDGIAFACVIKGTISEGIRVVACRKVIKLPNTLRTLVNLKAAILILKCTADRKVLQFCKQNGGRYEVGFTWEFSEFAA